MPTLKLTQAVVDSLPYQDSTTWYHDTDLAGLALGVGRTTKTYYVGGEHKKKFVRVKIGRADVTKANEARAVARDVLLPELRRGIDPRAKSLTDDEQASDFGRILAGIREARPAILTDDMAQALLHK